MIGVGVVHYFRCSVCFSVWFSVCVWVGVCTVCICESGEWKVCV